MMQGIEKTTEEKSDDEYNRGIEEIAERFGKSIITIRKIIINQKIKYEKKENSLKRLYKWSDFEEFYQRSKNYKTPNWIYHGGQDA